MHSVGFEKYGIICSFLVERCEYLHALLISTPDTVGQLQALDAVMTEEYYRYPSNGKLVGSPAGLDDMDKSLP